MATFVQRISWPPENVLGSKPTVWDGDLTLGSLPCPMFKGLGSKPTVWDGDIHFVLPLLDTGKYVLSPPCGMVTVFSVSIQIFPIRSKPTVWDGDLVYPA